MAARELVDDHEADVVAVPRVLAAGIAETDDEQVERRGAFAPFPGQAHLELLLGFGVAAALVGGVVALGGILGLGLGLGALGALLGAFLGLLGTSSRASWTEAITVSSGSSRSLTPSGTTTSASRSVSPMPSSDTSPRGAAGPRAGAPRRSPRS